MLKRVLSSIFLFLSCTAFSQSIQPQQRILWGVGVDQFYNAKILSTGNILLLGRTDSHRNGGYQNKDGWSVILTPQGDTISSISYGGESRTDRFWDAEEDANGDLIFVGSSGSFGGSENVYVVRTSASGELIDSYNYGEKGFDRAYDIELMDDGGWFIVGESKTQDQDSDTPFNILIIRCDVEGTPIWMKKIISGNASYGVKTLIDEQNSIYVLGKTMINDRSHMTLYGFNKNGKLKFSKTYAGTSSQGEWATDMIFGQNDELYISGFTQDSTFNGFLMKTDLKGQVLQSSLFQTKVDLEFIRIIQDTDANLWTVGFCKTDSTTVFAPLVQLDSDLNLIKSTAFRPLNDNVYFSTVKNLNEDQLLLVGAHTQWFGDQRGGYYVIKNKYGNTQTYETPLSIDSEQYEIKLIPTKPEFIEVTEHSKVNTLVIPVPMNEIRIE